jgi:hypothetical protein
MDDEDPVIDAPELLEVAQTWWDVERVPRVVWDAEATVFELVDPEDVTLRLTLARFATSVTDPVRVATALSEGLAACDFPPTGDGLAPGRAALTLRTAGITDTPEA